MKSKKNKVKRKVINKKWHNYFAAGLKELVTPIGYNLETEVEVGKMPLKIDVVIIKRKSKKKYQTKSEILKTLNKFNVVEYKSPDDKLDLESFDKLFAYALLFKIKNKIKSRSMINTYAFTSGNVGIIEKYISENKHKLNKLSKGIYYSNFGFNFYLIDIKDLPVNRETKIIKLFGKIEEKEKLINEILQQPEKDENLITVTAIIIQELYPELFKEVLEMAKKTETPTQIWRKYFNEIGYKNALKFFDEKELINSMDARKVINAVGEDRIVNSIGEENIFKSLIKKLGKKRIQELANQY